MAEDYAADLRNFHAPSRTLKILSAVCPGDTNATDSRLLGSAHSPTRAVILAPSDIGDFLLKASRFDDGSVQLSVQQWNAGAYRPVPTIIEAASMIYVSNSVSDIQNKLSDHANLTSTITRLAEIRRWAMDNKKFVVCFVTGVPGSGKTLVGLDLVHDPRFGSIGSGDAAFLSGNSPLVGVLREALAKDSSKSTGSTIADERDKVRVRIQHLINYLAHYLDQEPDAAPHEHIVVFDEAQRAWDAAFGKRKFGRSASEPTLFLNIMARHRDWAMIVALVGGGQEINSGEQGLKEWGAALQTANASAAAEHRWTVIGSVDTIGGRATYGGTPLWPAIPLNTDTIAHNDLHLSVSIRSHRNEVAIQWISALLDGRQLDARRHATEVAQFPIYITRSLQHAQRWLRATTVGNRRCGLLATSGARRLRGYGLGVTLKVTEMADIIHWFLASPDDLRSSQALEVTGTEFACQGLEIDRACVCWDHDMVWSPKTSTWLLRTFRGTKWQSVKDEAKRRYIANSYRVLLSRAREALIIWIPPGDHSDSTRPPAEMDATYRYLSSCGVRALDDAEAMCGVG